MTNGMQMRQIGEAMGSVAVVAHAGKTFGGGLSELRAALEQAGVPDPIWYEVPKSKYAPKKFRRALDDGADVVFVWGGDGMVQHCIDAAVGSKVTIAIVPAGTANLLASNLGIEQDIGAAVRVGLHGVDRRLDVGVVNGEHFAVMAGTGLDASMIADADGPLKDRLGRAAYILTAAKQIRAARVRARVRVDGDTWFVGQASCVLVGNVGRVLGEVAAFPDAVPDDGLLDIGVVSAKGLWQWARTLGRTVAGEPDRSPFVQIMRGRAFDVRLDRAMPYELDGGARKARKRLRIKILPSAVTIRVPPGSLS